jgi:hypothetical protein
MGDLPRFGDAGTAVFVPRGQEAQGRAGERRRPGQAERTFLGARRVGER